MQPVGATVIRLLGQLHAALEQGEVEVTVSFSQADIGAYNQLDLTTSVIVEDLQSLGHSVTDIDGPGESGDVVHLRVRPRPTTTWGAPSILPAPESTGPDETGDTGAPMTAGELWAYYESISDMGTVDAAEKVWRKSVERGWPLPDFEELSQRERFWLMAYPVLAAEVLRLEGRPVEPVAHEARLADAAVRVADPDSPSQRQALQVCERVRASWVATRVYG
jgi:hypothetical protein